MTRVIARIRRWYGAHPLHLLALLAAFALAGYAVRAVVAAGQWQVYALWFLVAIVGHDLLLFPLYSLADLSLRRLLPWREGGASTAPNRMANPQPPVINHLRVPAGLSLLLLLVWFPLILRLSSSAYHRASGLTATPYLWRWLAVTGVMFLASAVGYALRLRHAAATRTPPNGHKPESGLSGDRGRRLRSEAASATRRPRTAVSGVRRRAVRPLTISGATINPREFRSE
ncbi:MAG TPA: hypothetical protein VGR98_23800 [Streptosporangiaceae bacterium]|nr:hypothetical protein [Streptosporangiaceae bacterium]